MMPLTRGMAQRPSRASRLCDDLARRIGVDPALRLRSKRRNSAASAIHSISESAQKGRSRATVVLQPSAAGMVSTTGCTSVPAREKIGMPVAKQRLLGLGQHARQLARDDVDGAQHGGAAVDPAASLLPAAALLVANAVLVVNLS